MKPVTAFVGGSIGADPYSPRTWSGSAPFLFRAMSEAGLLESATGLELPRPVKALLLAKNFSRQRTVWRKHFYMDPAYRNALTRTAARVKVQTPFALQVGHMFSLPSALRNLRCISYHDGNLPESLKSGFGLEGVSRRRIDQALRFEEDTANQMAAVFTFSEYLRQSFIHDYHVPAERVFNVGGGVNLAELPPAQHHKDYSVPRILFLGTDFVRKGGPQVLQAFPAIRAALPTAELHIAGPHNGLGALPEGVYFHGHLAKSDPAQAAALESLFRQSSLFVLPSLYEPFGIAPVEAMLYQLPCVVTNAWALRETVRPGINGEVVEKGSPEDLAARIITLLSNPAGLAQMGAAGRQIALDNYTWTSVANRMKASLHQLG